MPTDLFHGYLFIGDPHLAARAPGRRRDDYPSAVLHNLAQAAALAHAQHLYPVLLGDLFHRANENHLPTLLRLLTVLRQFPVPPLLLEGNHDHAETRLTPEDAVTLLAAVGAVRVLTSTGLVPDSEVQGPTGARARLFAVPYGAPLPTAVPTDAAVATVVISHHDLAFPGSYPGAAAIPGIAGCAMLVNGHLHKTLPSVTVEGMRAHNPGNIARLTLDVADHQEAVWSFVPDGQHYELTQHVLDFVPDVFDRTGHQVVAAAGAEAVAELTAAPSQFAALYGREQVLEADRSNDASVLREDLEAGLTAAEASVATRALLLKLADELAPVA